MRFFMVETLRRERLMAVKWLRGRRGAVIGVAAIAGAVAGVYVSLAIYGKDGSEVAAACADTPRIAEQVAPFVKGEVAAFRLADPPENLAAIAFKDPNGGDTSLGAFAGRTLLVNLWATWCVPCRAEMPTLDRLAADLGGEDFEVLAINIDLNNPDRARAFLDDIGVEKLEFYSDPTSNLFSDLKKQGLAFGLPVTFLIDEHGCRIGSVNGPAEWDSEDAKAMIGAALDTS
jgi:thiol-disulfide isomerase/thioredoxin